MQKGYKHTLETRKKQSLSALKRDNTNRIKSLPKGSKHWNYTNTPNVLALHKRIHRKYGKASGYLCKCGSTAKDWAFIGKKEYTDKREDYIPLCRKCHIALDNPHLKRGPKSYIRNKNNKGQFIKSL